MAEEPRVVVAGDPGGHVGTLFDVDHRRARCRRGDAAGKDVPPPQDGHLAGSAGDVHADRRQVAQRAIYEGEYVRTAGRRVRGHPQHARAPTGLGGECFGQCVPEPDRFDPRPPPDPQAHEPGRSPRCGHQRPAEHEHGLIEEDSFYLFHRDGNEAEDGGQHLDRVGVLRALDAGVERRTGPVERRRGGGGRGGSAEQPPEPRCCAVEVRRRGHLAEFRRGNSVQQIRQRRQRDRGRRHAADRRLRRRPQPEAGRLERRPPEIDGGTVALQPLRQERQGLDGSALLPGRHGIQRPAVRISAVPSGVGVLRGREDDALLDVDVRALDEADGQLRDCWCFDVEPPPAFHELRSRRGQPEPDRGGGLVLGEGDGGEDENGGSDGVGGNGGEDSQQRRLTLDAVPLVEPRDPPVVAFGGERGERGVAAGGVPLRGHDAVHRRRGRHGCRRHGCRSRRVGANPHRRRRLWAASALSSAISSSCRT